MSQSRLDIDFSLDAPNTPLFDVVGMMNSVVEDFWTMLPEGLANFIVSRSEYGVV